MTSVAAIEGPGYSLLPHTFISPGAVERLGWEQVQAGWLIETTQPLTDDELASAREMAATAGLTVEAERTRQGCRKCDLGQRQLERCSHSAFSP